MRQLDDLTTDIQTLVTKMSPTFNKCTEACESNTQDSDPWYGIKWDIHWGTQLDNTLNMKIHATRSVEQLLWLLNQQNTLSRSTEVTHAINHRLSGQVTDRLTIRDAINTYNHIHWTVNATKVPESLKDAAVMVQETLKFSLWPYYSRSHSMTPASNLTTDIVLDISEINNKVDMAVVTPTETDMFVDMPLTTTLFNLFKPTQNVRPIVNQFIETATDGFAPATCTVNDFTVSTFDTLSFPVSTALPRGCQTVLAMDCSVDASFVVVRRPHTHEVDIVFGENVITVEPTKPVLLNKEPLDLPEGEIIQIDGVLIKKVHTVTSVTVTPAALTPGATLWQMGVTVTVTRDTVTVQVPAVFKQRMCGLCSNFDGQRSWELETPSGNLAPTPAMFALSYVLPGSCPVQTLEDTRQRLHPRLNDTVRVVEEDHEENDGCYAKEITKVKLLRKKNQACFSQPLQRCSFDCEDYSLERSKVTYHCFSQPLQ